MRKIQADGICAEHLLTHLHTAANLKYLKSVASHSAYHKQPNSRLSVMEGLVVLYCAGA